MERLRRARTGLHIRFRPYLVTNIGIKQSEPTIGKLIYDYINITGRHFKHSYRIDSGTFDGFMTL